MKSDQIVFYNTTVNEALEMLNMESRRDNALINMDEFEVKLNKRGDHVKVTLERSLEDMSIEEGIVQLKIDFPHKYRDMESIERVQAILALNPNSDWWKGVLEELQTGDPLHYRVEEILIETEERIENPDQEVLGKLNQAIALQPNSRFFRSLYDQLRGGRELSERQLEVLENALPNNQMVSNQPNPQLARIEEALKLDPRNSFLTQLKSRSEGGITLSPRQMNVVEEVIASQSSPASKMLADLKSNAYLDRNDFMLINKGQRRGIDALNDEERKRLRHLIYRNQRKLDNTYSKEEVRRLLKKGNTMRRSASEIIRNLEMRIARLEKSSGMFDSWTMAYPRRATPTELRDYKVSRPMGKMIQYTYTGEGQPVTLIPLGQRKHHKGGFVTLVLAEFDTDPSRYFILKGKSKDLGEELIHEIPGHIPKDMALAGLKAKAVDFKLASMNRKANRHNVMPELNSKPERGGVASRDMYHTGRSLESDGAMLYYIGASENKSKFYELRLWGNQVFVMWGRLGSAGRRSDKTFATVLKAEQFYQSKLSEKLGKGYVSCFAVSGKHSKTTNSYGKYPMGLTTEAGPWQNQDISYQQGSLRETMDAVEGAIASFLVDGRVDADAVKMLVETKNSLSRNRDALSKEVQKDIRLSLDRIRGTGRMNRYPVEVRTRTAIKGLRKLLRKLESAMTGGHRRASR